MHLAFKSKTQPIYNIIVQYEQSIVKYAEKWRKMWLKTAYMYIFKILEYNKILMPTVASRMTVVPIRILIRTTLVPIRILIRMTAKISALS